MAADPDPITDGHLGMLMLSLVVVAIMLGFPTAFTLMGMGMMANINAPITEEYAELLASELGVQLEFRQPETLEDKIAAMEAAGITVSPSPSELGRTLKELLGERSPA
mgnify:CR=1 FL=1